MRHQPRSWGLRHQTANGFRVLLKDSFLSHPFSLSYPFFSLLKRMAFLMFCVVFGARRGRSGKKTNQELGVSCALRRFRSSRYDEVARKSCENLKDPPIIRIIDDYSTFYII